MAVHRLRIHNFPLNALRNHPLFIGYALLVVVGRIQALVVLRLAILELVVSAGAFHVYNVLQRVLGPLARFDLHFLKLASFALARAIRLAPG